MAPKALRPNPGSLNLIRKPSTLIAKPEARNPEKENCHGRARNTNRRVRQMGASALEAFENAVRNTHGLGVGLQLRCPLSLTYPILNPEP